MNIILTPRQVRHIVFYGMVGGFLAAYGIYTLGSEFYDFLKQGLWRPFSLIDAMQYPVSDSPRDFLWLFFPTDWIGVHKIMRNIPFSVALILFGTSWAQLGRYRELPEKNTTQN